MADERTPDVLAYDASDEYRPDPSPPPEIPTWKDGGVRIGIHTSIAGDIVHCLDLATELGANALQIFSSSPRKWASDSARIAEVHASRFRRRRKELGLGPLVIHANYLINLATANPVLRTRSIQAFHHEILRAVTLGADYLVTHPGSCGQDGPDVGVRAVAQGLKQAARGVELGQLTLLLENTAGQGSSLGCLFEELQAILAACPSLPMGICIDTAHLFAAGWDIRTSEGLDHTLAEIDRILGLGRLSVLHMNDSKTDLGSRVDRHEHIGKGKIGLGAFERILKHPRLAGRAFILETPIDLPGDDYRNVSALWKLVGQETVSAGRNGMKPRRRKATISRTKAPKNNFPKRPK